MTVSSPSARFASRVAPRLARDAALVRSALTNPLTMIPAAAYDRPIVRVSAFGRDTVYVSAPELVHEALVRLDDHVAKGEPYRRPLAPLLGDGLLNAEDEAWRWQRRAIAPVFRAAGLARFLPAMIAQAEASRDRLAAAGGNAPVAVNTETIRLTFDIIVETMFSGSGGLDLAKTSSELARYLELSRWSVLSTVVGMPPWMPHPGKLRSRGIATSMRGRVEVLVAARRAEGVPRHDLVDLLLGAVDPQTGRRMTDGEVTDNLLTFLLAGHETTALGLAWTLDLLARHPEHIAAIREEIDAVTGGGPVAPEHVAQFHRARQAFEEGMRLYPPAALIPRQVSRPFEIGGERLDEKVGLIIPVYAVHRNRLTWDDPDRFDPDRFAPEAAAARHRYAFMPFGAGPRTCIGMSFAMTEAVAVLAVLLRDLDLTPAEPVPPEPVLDITLRPSRDLMLHVRRRA